MLTFNPFSFVVLWIARVRGVKATKGLKNSAESAREQTGEVLF